MATTVDREEVIYHGTTLDVAQEIGALDQFGEQPTYFAATRGLAEFFARRTAAKKLTSKVPNAQNPAIVRVTLYASDLAQMKLNKLVASKGFDEGDNPALRGRTQMLFSGEAIRFLNIKLLELEVETVGAPAPG